MFKRLSRALAIMFVAVLAALALAVPARAAGTITPANITLYDLDGSTSTLNSRYSGMRRVIIVGRPSCGNTQNAVSQAQTLSNTGAYDSVSFLVLDVDGDSETFRDGFGMMETDRLRFYSSDSGIYSSWAHTQYTAFTGEGTGGVTLPYLVVMDETNHLVYASTGPVDLATVCRECFGITETVPNLRLYDIDGSATTMEERYGNTKRVVIIGRANCANTRATINSALKIADKSAYSGVNFLVLDYDGDSAAFTNAYSSWETDSVRFYSSGDDTYSSWGWTAYYGYTGESGSITLPFVVLIDDDNTISYVTYGSQNIAGLLATYLGIENPNLATLEVSGKVSTEAGMQLLDLVNEARAKVGSPELTWDPELAETAIQRAMEIAVKCSHTRPDGTSCFTAWPSWSMASAENIAEGQWTVVEVNDDWTNSSGHFANMVNEGMTKFAAAYYVNSDDEYFWVECFSAGESGASTGGTFTGFAERPVTFDFTDVKLRLSPWTSITYTYGSSAQLGPVMLGHADLLDTDVVWSSADVEVADVDTYGTVSFRSVGTTEITATLSSNPKVSGSVSVTTSPKSIESATVTLSGFTFEYTGKPICPSARILMNGVALKEGVDYYIEYENNINPGAATVKVNGIGNYKDTARKNFTITAAETFDMANASFSVGNQTYTGDPIRPEITVTYNGKTLAPGSDYTVEYTNNINPGKATVTVTGQGLYVGSKSVNFTILPFNIVTAEIKLAFYAITYTGKPATPKVTVTANGKTLVEGTDFEVAYARNVDVGDAEVSITGLGGYSNSVTRYFDITPAALGGASILVDPQAYTGSELTPKPTVKLATKTLVEGVDYTVESYSNNVELGTATVTIRGMGNYTGPISGSFKIVAADLSSAKVSAAQQTYTGSALKPAVTVTLGGKTLVSGTDYDVSYSNNFSVGTATITVTGKGNYTGKAIGTFTIAPAHATGWQNEGGAWYFYDEYGVMMTDHWESYNGVWYYFGADGKLVWNGWSYFEGVRYYMGKNGRLAKNCWAVVDGAYYYIGANYQPVVDGWVKYAGKYYYMDANGNPVVNDWVQYRGTWYHFNASGVCDRVG